MDGQLLYLGSPSQCPTNLYPRFFLGSTGGSVVKNLPANAGDARDPGKIPRLGNPLEKDMATHSSILAWKISGQRSLVGCSPWGCKESDATEYTHTRVSPRAQALPDRILCSAITAIDVLNCGRHGKSPTFIPKKVDTDHDLRM